MDKKLNVGGQAVIEGVMMRSPQSFTVAVRRANGDILVREAQWRPLWQKLRFLKWPFLRGAIVLIEALHNGMSALSFSASQAAEDDMAAQAEEDAKAGRKPSTKPKSGKKDETQELSKVAITLTVIASIGLGLFFFLALPHLLTWLIGLATGVEGLKDGQSAPFHIVDGIIKMAIFLLYVWLISKIEAIRRVFQYHGAEHKAIFTFEAGEELTVENARRYTTYHPRCGTSFILIVVMTAILVFFAVLPFVPALSETAWVNQLLLIAVKLPLMFPIAGLAYEMQKLSAKYCAKSAFFRALIKPGLWLQRITTQPPSDEQLEVALVAVRKVLQREAAPDDLPKLSEGDEADVERFGSFDDFITATS